MPSVLFSSFVSISSSDLCSCQTDTIQLAAYQSTLALTMSDLMDIDWTADSISPTILMQPPAKARKRKAPTLRDSDWEPYRKRLTELYTAGMLLKDLKEQMEVEFNFFAEYVFIVRYV
jgi:hypothetical protein